MSGRFLRHDTCPSCGSADNLAVYEDHEYCFGFGCNHYRSFDNTATIETKRRSAISTPLQIGLPSREMPGLKERGLSASTINKYGVTVNTKSEGNIEAVFPLFNSNFEHVANQVRKIDKQFRVEGDLNESLLFGQPLFPGNGRSVTITEGYYDTMAAYQMQGSRYPCVGVMSASSAKKEIVSNLEWLESFDKVVINFDSDAPGQKAAKECAALFTPGKACVLSLREHKDADDYLVNDKVKEYVNEWFRASPFMPDGLKLGTELWEDIRDHKTPFSVPYPWSSLNQKTYGLRLSELVLLLADTGSGKTTICKAIEHSLITNPDLEKQGAGVGLLHLEEPKYDTAIGLMSIHAGKPFHLPDTEKTEEELREAYDAVINTERLVLWDHFGSNDIDVVLAKIRHMAALGCKYFVVDHLSIIVSDQRGDERKQLDEISTKLKTMMMNLNIAVIAVIHINRQGQVRGSAGPEQVANIVIRLERDKKDPDEWRRNVTELIVEKNRFCGRTGPAGCLWYNEITGTLEELSPDLEQAFLQGRNLAGLEFEAYNERKAKPENHVSGLEGKE